MDDLVKRLRDRNIAAWGDVRSEARNAALEEAAKACDDEADKCDDAVKWGGAKRYVQDCKAAAYAMRNRAAAIRAMKEGGQ